ncbi:flagella synthesis protein FlgN [Variovorax sp. OV329]|uniref:flagella synthesis protein FlgN n=1 Tax=Variovorax sp. OV329 TaxID=1882825 RepID=UPI0008F34399|nr:flagellar protein FlgN [Variovorax sp. OV329]SFN18197.1 flagella synthesis protein FlgN [Variovorax sp. OV329]
MNALLKHLRAESAAIADFIALLGEEEQAMVGGSFSDLPALTHRKSELQRRMGELDQQREALQKAMGFPTGRAGADAAAASQGEETHAAWAHLLALAGQAQAGNSHNASIVFTHLDFTQNALRFLRASGQMFYGPDGARRSAAGTGNRLALG